MEQEILLDVSGMQFVTNTLKNNLALFYKFQHTYPSIKQFKFLGITPT